MDIRDGPSWLSRYYMFMYSAETSQLDRVYKVYIHKQRLVF